MSVIDQIDQISIVIGMSGKEGRNLNTVRKEQARKHLHTLYTFRLSGQD